MLLFTLIYSLQCAGDKGLALALYSLQCAGDKGLALSLYSLQCAGDKGLALPLQAPDCRLVNCLCIECFSSQFPVKLTDMQFEATLNSVHIIPTQF